MSGTRDGGLRAAEVNKKRHGEDFYQKIGSIGGKNGHTGGFASNPDLARKAGAKGGKFSSRGIPRCIMLNGKKYQFDTVQEASKFVAKNFGVKSYKYIDGEKTITTTNGQTITIMRDSERSL